ncbi:MAG: hypothetical protein WAM78_19245 [Candidatus Sulfotelmatobacter sp.]
MHVRRASSLGDAHQSELSLSGLVNGDDPDGKIRTWLNPVNHQARELRFDFYALWIKAGDSTWLIVLAFNSKDNKPAKAVSKGCNRLWPIVLLGDIALVVDDCPSRWPDFTSASTSDKIISSV